MASPPDNSLTALIAKQIQANGPMGLDTFMQLALHHTAHGYYARAQGIGRAGDFITAPEISPLFGQALATWMTRQWQALGAPAAWRLVELGPGRGTLLATLLPHLRCAPQEFHLVEASPGFQAQISKRLSMPLTFVTDLGNLPESDLPTLIVGNEYLDALPIRQFRQETGKTYEICIDLDEAEKLRFVQRAANPQPSPLEGDGWWEVCPAAIAQVSFLCEEIKASGGAVLLIDYGYDTAPGRPTFQALKDHTPVSPLKAPGNADLTALVDFAALAKSVRACGLEPNLTPQGDLLIDLGLAELLEAQPEQAAAVARLVRADAMGRLFQALSFAAPRP